LNGNEASNLESKLNYRKEKGRREVLSDTEARFARDLSALEVAKHNEFLTGAGPRYVAAAGEEKVMHYMAERFAEYGLEVDYDQFEALAFEPRSVELKVTAPIERELEAGAVFFSEPTQGLSGEVVFVGNGEDTDYLDYGPMHTTVWLNEALAQAAEDLNYSIAHTPCILGLSDATPFLHHGVPAAWLWKYDDPFWHSPLDDAMHVDPNSFKVTAEIVGLTALRVANQD
jgi:hypothetical protein